MGSGSVEVKRGNNINISDRAARLLGIVNSITNPVTVQSTSYALDVARGNVAGVKAIEVFGDNPDVDSINVEDIWCYGGTYTYSSSAVIHYISSSNAGDTQSIKVYGLDTNWDLQEVSVTLQGQTKTQIGTGETFIRIWRVKNDGSTDLAGDLYVYEDDTITAGIPDTATKVRGHILNGNNQSLMSHFTIPNGKTGYIASCSAGLSKKKDGLSNIRMYFREFEKVFQVKGTETVSSTGSSIWSCNYPFFRAVYDHNGIQAKTDIKLTADSSVADAGVSASYTILLVDD